MLHQFQQIVRRGGSHAGPLLAGGLAAVAGLNMWLWRRDRALAERLRGERPPVPALARASMISALVAAWNEGERIEAHIRSFLALAYPRIELVLCAGGSDATLETARSFASDRVTVIEQRPGEGKQRALARCMAHARGEIIYLTDADCLFDDEALVRLVAPLVDEGEHAATGGSRPLDGQIDALLPAMLWAADVAAGARQPRYVGGLLGRNAAVTRAAIEQIGGLDFDAPTGTDYQLAKRLRAAGVAIRHVPASVLCSHYPDTVAAYRRKQSRWLRNLLLYGRRYGARHDVMVTLRTIATGTAMLVLPFSALVLGPLLLVLWLVLVAHAACSRLRYLRFAGRLLGRPTPPRIAAGIVPMTLLDFVVWALPVLELLIPTRRTRW